MDEVLEEIRSRHVKFAKNLGTLLFNATITLIMLSRLLKTIKLLHSLPHLNQSLTSHGMLIVEPPTMLLLNLATSL